jgi:hypothetical protein
METCDVIVSGRNLGLPPINTRPVAAGTYILQVSCDKQIVGGSKSVTVPPGEAVRTSVP